MTPFVNAIFVVANVISSFFVIILGVFGVYEQIMGPDDAEKLLRKLRIPLSYKQVLIIWFAGLFFMIVVYIIWAKLNRRI